MGFTSQLSHHRAIRLFMMVLISAGFALALGEASAQTDATSPTIYRLNAGSGFQQGCFPPCLCPLQQGVSVRGTFRLASTGSDGLFDSYTVDEVNWIVSMGDRELLVTGFGTYTIGGEFAVQQQLVLDLKVGDDPVQHFDSGLAPGSAQFPDINVTISIHGQVCFDTVFLVDASPVPSDQIHPYALLPESTFQRGCFPPMPLCARHTAADQRDLHTGRPRTGPALRRVCGGQHRLAGDRAARLTGHPREGSGHVSSRRRVRSATTIESGLTGR